MSATEIIREIQKLTDAERKEVQAYLLHSSRANDPRWREELARRIDEARAGRSLTSAEVRALVAQATRTNGLSRNSSLADQSRAATVFE